MVKNDQNDLDVLHHVAKYRVATRTSAAANLPEGVDADKRLAKLVRLKLLRVHRGLPGNRSLYQLTKKGASAAGVSPARGRLLGTQSLLKNLGVLLFCVTPGSARVRAETEELGRALGAELPDGAYCLCRVKERTVVFDCYVPGALTPITSVVRHLAKVLRASRKLPPVAAAIKDLRYGLAVIVPNKHRRKSIMDAVRTAGADGKAPLIKRVRIWVEAVEPLAAYFGTAAPRLGSTSKAVGQTLLWDTEQ